MTLLIKTYVLGELENNAYLLVDDATRLAAVVDPSFDSEVIITAAVKNGWTISTILLTHAHFDHIAGVQTIFDYFKPHPLIYLHSDDLPLYQEQGHAREFGIDLGILPTEVQLLSDGQVLALGETNLEVRHTPGHTPGHVIFYCAEASAAFCGDLVFAGSVGRTDLPGGSSLMLIRSIRHSIVTLPRQTRLLCGHGPETTVGDEMDSNPYF